MLIKNNKNIIRQIQKTFGGINFPHSVFTLLIWFGILTVLIVPVYSQSNVTGGFEGRVTDESGVGIGGVTVQFINVANGFQTARRTDSQGNFQQDFLSPGIYNIRVEFAGYELYEKKQELYATRSNRFLPIPIQLKKINTSGVTTPTPTPTTTTTATTVRRVDEANSDIDSTASLNPRRDGAFNSTLITSLPLGGSTLTRTFDELALLIPGVNPAPLAIGNTVGPGVGGGVGTSGQFSVNGLRSRANNFTVDGSDNNDEDIGVRRQGFFSLVPQPIESIQEFQIITLLAPAQYGRNLGAQVNAISKSGGNQFRGSVFGLMSFDRFNAPNFFDNTGGDTTRTLKRQLSSGSETDVLLNGGPIQVTNNAGEKDVFTLLQGGFAVGGPIVKNKLFFFVSGEFQSLDGTREKNFAVPTVEQRSVFNAPQGLQACSGIIENGICRNRMGVPIAFTPGFPTSLGGDAIFSLFPFANNPNGIYGRNTFTQALSTDARGIILSGKLDYNFFRNTKRPQTFTARYNFTDDERDLTDVGGALFSAIRPLVRTDNFSSYLTGALNSRISNEFRFSWGRTQLRFEEIPDSTGTLIPVSSSIIRNAQDRRFLLNAPVLYNVTLPPNCSPTGCVGSSQTRYRTNLPGLPATTQESDLGPIGQLIVAGFSPLGVDVFNFPQERTNNTLQFADTMRFQTAFRGQHSFAFGADIRRTTLNSDLPRNSRPLVTFYGGQCVIGQVSGCNTGYAQPLDLAAVSAATGFFQSLILPGNTSQIELNYFQLNFFVQDEWRIAPNFIVNYGLRYELNTTPKEADNKIEKTFQLQQQLFPSFGSTNLLQGFRDIINGRSKIYDADYNNFAPRFGFAWSPTKNMVIRGGYGIYYDQIIGSVVSQSRNVFPTFVTANTGGGDLACYDNFTLLNPITAGFNPINCSGIGRIVAPGSLNTLNIVSTNNPNGFSFLDLISGLYLFPFVNGTSFGTTLPTRKLDTPMSHQYSFSVEQRLFGNTFLSVGYVGTLGRNLLRFTTPNLGNNYIALVESIILDGNDPAAIGVTFDPFILNNNLRRPNRNIGPVNQFETTGRSRYDSLQVELRGRLLNKSFQYQVNYVFGKVTDDVSDVFDLAGSFALPQNSINLAGEYAPANFDVRHRFTYNFVYDLPSLRNQNNAIKFLFGDWQISGTGKFNTGQPFTVNTIYDVNFDGNLTDRLNNTQFIVQTGNNRNPLQLTCTTEAQCLSMLAPFGRDGAIPRNSFRAGNLLELDLSFAKRWTFRETHSFQFRVDVFNFINRANFGIPVRFLEAPGFGQATDTITPGRRIQFVLKYSF